MDKDYDRNNYESNNEHCEEYNDIISTSNGENNIIIIDNDPNTLDIPKSNNTSPLTKYIRFIKRLKRFLTLFFRSLWCKIVSIVPTSNTIKSTFSKLLYMGYMLLKSLKRTLLFVIEAPVVVSVVVYRLVSLFMKEYITEWRAYQTLIRTRSPLNKSDRTCVDRIEDVGIPRNPYSTSNNANFTLFNLLDPTSSLLDEFEEGDKDSQTDIEDETTDRDDSDSDNDSDRDNRGNGDDKKTDSGDRGDRDDGDDGDDGGDGDDNPKDLVREKGDVDDMDKSTDNNQSVSTDNKSISWPLPASVNTFLNTVFEPIIRMYCRLRGHLLQYWTPAFSVLHSVFRQCQTHLSALYCKHIRPHLSPGGLLASDTYLTPLLNTLSPLQSLPLVRFYSHIYHHHPRLLLHTAVVNYLLPLLLEFGPWWLAKRRLSAVVWEVRSFLEAVVARADEGGVDGASTQLEKTNVFSMLQNQQESLTLPSTASTSTSNSVRQTFAGLLGRVYGGLKQVVSLATRLCSLCISALSSANHQVIATLHQVIVTLHQVIATLRSVRQRGSSLVLASSLSLKRMTEVLKTRAITSVNTLTMHINTHIRLLARRIINSSYEASNVILSPLSSCLTTFSRFVSQSIHPPLLSLFQWLPSPLQSSLSLLYHQLIRSSGFLSRSLFKLISKTFSFTLSSLKTIFISFYSPPTQPSLDLSTLLTEYTDRLLRNPLFTVLRSVTLRCTGHLVRLIKLGAPLISIPLRVLFKILGLPLGLVGMVVRRILNNLRYFTSSPLFSRFPPSFSPLSPSTSPARSQLSIFSSLSPSLSVFAQVALIYVMLSVWDAVVSVCLSLLQQQVRRHTDMVARHLVAHKLLYSQPGDLQQAYAREYLDLTMTHTASIVLPHTHSLDPVELHVLSPPSTSHIPLKQLEGQLLVDVGGVVNLTTTVIPQTLQTAYVFLTSCLEVYHQARYSHVFLYFRPILIGFVHELMTHVRVKYLLNTYLQDSAEIDVDDAQLTHTLVEGLQDIQMHNMQAYELGVLERVMQRQLSLELSSTVLFNNTLKHVIMRSSLDTATEHYLTYHYMTSAGLSYQQHRLLSRTLDGTSSLGRRLLLSVDYAWDIVDSQRRVSAVMETPDYALEEDTAQRETICWCRWNSVEPQSLHCETSPLYLHSHSHSHSHSPSLSSSHSPSPSPSLSPISYSSTPTSTSTSSLSHVTTHVTRDEHQLLNPTLFVNDKTTSDCGSPTSLSSPLSDHCTASQFLHPLDDAEGTHSNEVVKPIIPCRTCVDIEAIDIHHLQFSYHALNTTSLLNALQVFDHLTDTNSTNRESLTDLTYNPDIHSTASQDTPRISQSADFTKGPSLSSSSLSSPTNMDIVIDPISPSNPVTSPVATSTQTRPGRRKRGQGRGRGGRGQGRLGLTSILDRVVLLMKHSSSLLMSSVNSSSSLSLDSIIRSADNLITHLRFHQKNHQFSKIVSTKYLNYLSLLKTYISDLQDLDSPFDNKQYSTPKPLDDLLIILEPHLSLNITPDTAAYNTTQNHHSSIEPIISFRRGQSYAIVGKNRSGKSTLMSILTRLLDYTDLRYLVNSIPHEYKHPTNEQGSMLNRLKPNFDYDDVISRPAIADINVVFNQSSSNSELQHSLPMSLLPRVVLRSTLMFVSQKPYVFAGTVFDNIVCGDPWLSVAGQQIPITRGDVCWAAEMAGLFLGIEDDGMSSLNIDDKPVLFDNKKSLAHLNTEFSTPSSPLRKPYEMNIWNELSDFTTQTLSEYGWSKSSITSFTSDLSNIPYNIYQKANQLWNESKYDGSSTCLSIDDEDALYLEKGRFREIEDLLITQPLKHEQIVVDDYEIDLKSTNNYFDDISISNQKTENNHMNNINSKSSLSPIYLELLKSGLKTNQSTSLFPTLFDHPLLDLNIHPRGENISGGFAQSIALARVFLRIDRQFCICDEAMGQMDTIKIQTVLPRLRLLAKTRHMGLIIVTHHLPTVTPHIDNVIVLEKGNVVQQGHHDDLIQIDGVYRQLFSE